MSSAKSPDDDALSKEMNLDTTKSATKLRFFGKEKDESAETVPGWTIMRPLKRNNLGEQSTAKGNGTSKVTRVETNSSGDGIGEVEPMNDLRSDDGLLEDDNDPARRPQGSRHAFHHGNDEQNNGTGGMREYKVYKRRYFGLFQLVLLNIVVSWDVSVPYSSCLYFC